MASNNGAGVTNSVNLASQTSSLNSIPQINEHAPDLTLTFRSRRFQKMTTFWGIIVLMLLYVIFLALILPLHWYCTQRCYQSTFSIAVYTNCSMWFVTVVMTFIVYLEFEKVRRRGYASFYKRNYSLVKDPFVVFSFGNAILLIYTWILFDMNILSPRVNSILLNVSPSHMFHVPSPDNDFDRAKYFVGLQLTIALEIIVSFVFLIILTARIIKFNGLAQPPDAINDHILSRSIEPRCIVGYNETRDNHDLVIDRQIDNNNFLRRRCRLLYGSLKKLLLTLPSEQRGQHEELLRRYLEEHRDDDDDDDVRDALDINEYLGTGLMPAEGDDVPLISA